MVIQGVIRPPSELRAVADRTALYVAKNGRAFESRILGSAKGRTPKFAFLHETSPFHAYYEDRIQFYENGGEDEKDDDKKVENETKDTKNAKKKALEESRKKEKTQKASVIDPVAKASLTARQKIAKLRSAQEEQENANSDDKNGENDKVKAKITIPAPPTIHFLNIVCPSSLTIAQIETIQLVAQFAALEGKGGPFLHQLTSREWRNPAFAFLQPRHGHFAYFSALVDAYRRVLGLWTSSNASDDDGVKAMANNVDHCLQLAAYRSEYERYQEEQKRKHDEEGVLSGAAQIDWHDFVVVETIEFAADEVVELSMLPPPPPPPQSVPSVAAIRIDDEGFEESDGEPEEEEQIRVVPSYTPKVVAQQSNRVEMVIDPISGKSVAVKDMPEHMRIQLMNPKWAEERKKFQDKQKDSNLVSGDVVASNIARFAQSRGDVFGKTVSCHAVQYIVKKGLVETNSLSMVTLSQQEQSLLSKDSDSKTRLEEANRTLRESQHRSSVGPSLPQPISVRHVVPRSDPSTEPAVKRPRIESTQAPAPATRLLTTIVQAPPVPGYQQSTATAVEQSFEAPMQAAATSEPTASLLSESEFAATLSTPEVTLQIRVPNDTTQMAWNFYGQIVSVTVSVMSKVKSFKQEISKSHLNDMPVNKMQFRSTTSGLFLKDNMTLAALNIGPTATLELVPRVRGGKK